MAQSKWEDFRRWAPDRGVPLVGCLVAGAAALYASYDALVRLAVWAGWSLSAAPGLPLTVDVIALAAGVRYVRTSPEHEEARALAYKGVVWSGAASIIGNAIVHAGLTPGWSWGHRVVAVATSAVPAVALAYVVHLVAVRTPNATSSAPPRRRAATAPRPAEVPAPAPVPEIAHVPAPSPAPESERDIEDQDHDDEAETPRPVPVGAPRPGSIKARGLALIKATVEAGGNVPTTQEIKDALDCTPRHAQNIVRAWNERSA
ncbi:hypothetical protein ACIQVT_34500 [Streptomyces sp. NPDC100445]|uniref:hypothetical protein n=1 Tax=Streptomyces sp. NPDC100445 TaxID=3366102 RepID=UPI00382A718B